MQNSNQNVSKVTFDDLKSNQKSLLEKAQELKSKHVEQYVEEEEIEVEDPELDNMNFMTVVKNTALGGLIERKEQIKERVKTTWRIPKAYRTVTQREIQKVLKKYSVLLEGQNTPPPIQSFEEMKFPKKIIAILKEKKVKKPTPIQMVGLPTVLLGRDMIGIAPTGQGKTIVFLLPALVMAIEHEMNMPLFRGEGPLAIIIVPSHELAIQTYELACYYSQKLQEAGYPQIRCSLSIGGMDMMQQIAQVREGVHLMVGTPGRTSDMVDKQKFNMNLCRYIVLDEADRLLDMIFEKEIRNIIDHVPGARQTLLFSSTMPKKVQDFAKQALIDPIIVNVGRAGQVNLNVIQEVEYVKQEEKLQYLISCLQKTKPPVLIFCDKSNDVDDIHEYLLLKGIDVTSLHGGKKQEERTKAMKEFQQSQKDVLVATDIGAKGLDFPNVQHVINFDMPKEIESYVHRIGRTGRLGKTGRATTFVNKQQDENILSDLKMLLMEAKQPIPHFLKQITHDSQTGGCGFCGGLGHTIHNCNKLEQQKMKALTVSAQQNSKEELKQYLPDQHPLKVSIPLVKKD
ncbi:DEAD/DEAH-box helicase (macronuclear) [Tetrahymena thermophila SB210]|uniref:RNA helicase n=1 Tax=Tetrahymena thermophila (strain SB210) TaxID=312017 RepID=Q23WN3_TETTS|nr:DEAD/DEAH-box helicase [Tetrahymena thermophila SB210]EAS00947.3 DEAD/DEAH-box helicase [Tetrahymena thermophila SB210]|eukprot:XP_001021192.3 DEAD/DEAH-box helicase [Tetrahymena thermophila SB210]